MNEQAFANWGGGNPYPTPPQLPGETFWAWILRTSYKPPAMADVATIVAHDAASSSKKPRRK